MASGGGGSAIDASKIAGHSDVDMTADYTFVDIERQQELTRAIQDRLEKASQNKAATSQGQPTPEARLPPSLQPTKLRRSSNCPLQVG